MLKFSIRASLWAAAPAVFPRQHVPDTKISFPVRTKRTKAAPLS